MLWVFYFREVSAWHIEWKTWRCRRKMEKTKTWWKTERGKNITLDGGFWNCLMPTWLIIVHVSLCFRDGCLSATVTGITMKVSLFLLSTERMRYRNKCSTALHINKDLHCFRKTCIMHTNWTVNILIPLQKTSVMLNLFLKGEA